VHTAAKQGAWTRGFLREAFRYPFLQLGAGRLTARIHAGNSASRKFVEALGFKLEGIIRETLADGADLCVYGMLRRECRWLEAHG
jgi:RimJ/RimL family protein N-acetyltransferase